MTSNRGLSNQQKMLLHIYKDAAGIKDNQYRCILRDKTGVASAADRRFGQCQFDLVMAAIEVILWQRVDAALAPQPTSRYISDQYYWRKKCPAAGHINIRQRHTLEELWQHLASSLGSAGTNDYLLGIINQATGRRALVHQLKKDEAGYVIDALKDRLAAALKEQ